MLQGTTIIDFTRLLPGPLATQFLSQMGARVIRIEDPERQDMARTQPPFADGVSTLFGALNGGKETVSLNYRDPAGREALLDYVGTADVLIEQFRPGVMQDWGLDYDSLRAVNPQLIYISLSGYGQTGPAASRAGHDLNYLAEAGILSFNCDAAGKPVVPGVQLADIGSGSYLTVTACLSGLLRRAQTGQGAYLDVSMLDGLLPLMTIPLTQHWGGLDPYSANFLSGALVNYNVYACADGKWVALAALEMKFWRNFCQLVDRPDWIRQHPFELSVQVFPAEQLEALFRSRTQAEWIRLAEGKDVCLSPVRTLTEALADPHIQSRTLIQNVPGDPDGQILQPVFPIKLKDAEA